MTDPSPHTLILGMGNPILTDDGIGPRMVQRLQADMQDERIVFQNRETGGMEIIELIAQYDRVILIDAIKTQHGLPGTVTLYTPADFKETLHTTGLHDISFLTALRLADKLKFRMPDRVHIIAIEISEDMIFSEEFSPVIQSQYPEIYRQVRELVNRLL